MKVTIERMKDWKTVLAMSILALYLLFFQTLYQSEIEPPSQGWSKAMKIAEILNEKDTVPKNQENIVTLAIPEEKSFYTFWYDRGNLNYAQVNKDGQIVKNGILAEDLTEIQSLKAVQEGDQIGLYSIEENTLNKYVFTRGQEKITEKIKVEDNVKGMVSSDKILAYYGAEDLKIAQDSKQITLLEDVHFNDVGITKEGQNYHIAYCEELEDGKRILKYLVYNAESQTKESYTVSNLILNRSGYIDISTSNDLVNIIVLKQDKVMRTSWMEYFQFPINAPNKVSSWYTSIRAYASNMMVEIEKDNKIRVIVSEQISRGKYGRSMDLVSYTVENGSVLGKKLLTKTQDASVKPQFFKIDDYEYLQWVDIAGDRINLNFASDNPLIIDEAQDLKPNQLRDIFINTSMGIIAISYLIFIPLTYMAIPVLLMMFVAAFPFISWMERHTKKVLGAAMIVHMFTKYMFTKAMIWDKQEFCEMLPDYMHNPINIMVIFAITTIIAGYCTINYSRRKGKVLLFSSYIFYSVIDSIIYGLVILPFYYTYLVFPYFTKIN